MSLTVTRPSLSALELPNRLTFTPMQHTTPLALIAPLRSMGGNIRDSLDCLVDPSGTLKVFVSKDITSDADDFLDGDKIPFHVYAGYHQILKQEQVISWNKEMDPTTDDLTLVTVHGTILIPNGIKRDAPYYHYMKMYDVSDEFLADEHVDAFVSLRHR